MHDHHDHAHEHHHGPSSKLDKYGIIASFLCCIHCMGTSAFLISMPWLGTYIESHEIHLIILALIVPIAAFTLFRHVKHHGDKKPMILGGTGILFLVIALLFQHTYEIALTMGGSILLIAAHIINIQKCRCARK